MTTADLLGIGWRGRPNWDSDCQIPGKIVHVDDLIIKTHIGDFPVSFIALQSVNPTLFKEIKEWARQILIERDVKDNVLRETSKKS